MTTRGAGALFTATVPTLRSATDVETCNAPLIADLDQLGHLAALAARGMVEVRLRYGTTGRPEHRYIATRS